MNKEKYYKILFIVSALYNIINAVTFILVSIVATDLFPLFGVEIPPSMIWLQLSLILIALLGVGYILVSRDISKNHGLVFIGGLAKLSFFLLTVIYFFLGDVSILIVLLGGIDLLMVFLFIEFLIFQSKK
ncbi:MAG: hypothetical protein ACTSP9_15980 [Promethearchaeota archaeon]